MAQKIAEKLGYGWRLLATGLSFFSFGVGGLLLWVFVFPVLSLLPGNRRQRVSRGQKNGELQFLCLHRFDVQAGGDDLRNRGFGKA